MSNPTLKLTLGIVLSCAVAATTLAADFYVPRNYQTIQAAIDAASDGDTRIHIADGVYDENLLIAENGVFLIGAEQTVFTGTIQVAGATRVGVRGLSFLGFRSEVPRVSFVDSEQVSVMDCSFDSGLQAIDASDSNLVSVSTSTFVNQEFAIRATNSPDLSVIGCSFSRGEQGWIGVELILSDGASIEGNTFRGGLVFTLACDALTVARNSFRRSELTMNVGRSILVSENAFTGAAASPYSHFAIRGTNLFGSSIEQNTLKRTGDFGGLLLDGSNNLVHSNRIRKCGMWGIQLLSRGNFIWWNNVKSSREFDLYDETGGFNDYDDNVLGSSNL